MDSDWHHRQTHREERNGNRPAMLVIDSSYTLPAIRRLGIEQSVFARDLDGFFRHVWSVHPFGDVAEAGTPSGSGAPEFHELNERHSFVQARPGRFRTLARLFPLNFLLGQASLFRRLTRLVRNEHIAVIRVGDPLYIGLFGWMLAKRNRVSLVIRINGNNDKARASTGKPIFPRLLRTIAVEKAIERFVLKRADLVVAPNQDNVDFAVANGADPRRVSIFRYGNLLAPAHLKDPAERRIDETLFGRLGVKKGRYLLCVSRLEEIKFPDDAIRVLAAVRGADHDVKLLLAGEGPIRLLLEALAQQLGVTDHVIFAGNLAQDALAQLYACSAAVISPLTGRALSEAALGAAPIVAYDLDWQGDLIQTGVTGELVPFRDVDAMTAAAVKLLDDPHYARKMGDAVRSQALEMLDPVKLNAHERATYVKLLENSE
jgi:glycosyltransferase involved in cell wall biosynthesis